MNITIYTMNNLLLYLIYYMVFIFVIKIIAVQLDYSRSTACSVNYPKSDTTL